MVLTRARQHLLIALSVGLLCAVPACIRPQPVRRLPARLPAALVLVVDFADARTPAQAPPELESQVAEALEARNLGARPLGFGALAGPYTEVRDTPRRLALAAARAGDARLVVLVETSAQFYSPLSGRYKWNVTYKLSVARPAELGAAMSSESETSVHLDFAHEREPRALGSAARVIAREAGLLVDRFLGGTKL